VCITSACDTWQVASMEPLEERARRVLDQYLVRPVSPDPDSDDPAELAAWLDAEDHHVFAKAVTGLEGRERVVTALHYFENLSLEEIATLLGERRSTVASIAYRARRQLARNPDLAHRYTSEQKRSGGGIRPPRRARRQIGGRPGDQAINRRVSGLTGGPTDPPVTRDRAALPLRGGDPVLTFGGRVHRGDDLRWLGSPARRISR